jgi:site-specific DNA-methyltransferase (adenine-specific)
MINQVIHGDCFEVLKDIPDGSIDAVITDPPYGIGLAKWDNVVNIPLFTKEVKRVTNDFYAFFGQMPTMVDWINSANNENLHYCEHISWIKRVCVPSPRLQRSHESIIVYTLKNKKFYQTKGKYEDVKLPGVLVDVATLEGIDRHIKDLRLKLIKGDDYNHHTLASSRLPEYKRFSGGGDRSPGLANYTNVWSFLPPTQSERLKYQGNKNMVCHPTGKPLEVMKRLVEMLTPEGGTVLDPFAGSGTTALACKELNRNYICIEKEKEYIDIIHKRLNTPLIDSGLNVEETEKVLEDIEPGSHQLSLF